MGSFVDAGAVEEAEDASSAATADLFGAEALGSCRISGLTELFFRTHGCNDMPLAKRTVLPPSWEIWGYKLVAKIGQRYFSLWAGESAEYEMGVEIRDEALPDRKGGLYICDSPASAARQYIATSFPGKSLCVAMLRCACKGPFID